MLAETSFKFAGKQVLMQGISQDDWIFYLIFNNKMFYEIDLLKYMRFTLKKCDGYILDVGANIGNHSVFFGLIMEKPVACFEPNPPVFDILKYNLMSNNVNHKAYNIGLGLGDGRYSVDETHKGATNNIGAAKLFENGDGRIVVKKLDDIIGDINSRFKGKKLIAIKADIEGMEPEMLKGAINTLKMYKPDLFIEVCESCLMREIEDILFPLGYERLYSYAATPVWHFCHKSKLTLTRRIELALFRKIMIITDLPKRVLAAVLRRIGGN